MNTQWIKTSERAPTKADLPVWAYYKKDDDLRLFFKSCTFSADYWRPAKADIPEPPLEETQEDKDIAEAEYAWAAIGDPRITHHANFVGGYLAALAHERAEVAKMLPPQCPEWDKKAYNVQCAHAIEAIRARCEGGRK